MQHKLQDSIQHRLQAFLWLLEFRISKTPRGAGLCRRRRAAIIAIIADFIAFTADFIAVMAKFILIYAQL